MWQIYIVVAVLLLGLGFYLYFAVKLIVNHPKIEGELETFPIPEKKEKLVAKWEERMVLDSLKSTKEEKTKLTALLEPAERQEILSTEEEEKQRIVKQKTWFEKQKVRALRQLQPFKLKNVEFVSSNTFVEDGKEVYTRGYMLDASFTLAEVVNTHLQNKKKIVFYLSEESDGVFHKTNTNKHLARKHEAHVTVQVWST